MAFTRRIPGLKRETWGTQLFVPEVVVRFFGFPTVVRGAPLLVVGSELRLPGSNHILVKGRAMESVLLFLRTGSRSLLTPILTPV
jgi:hypothetical protein